MGENDINQLEKIFEVCGTPNEQIVLNNVNIKFKKHTCKLNEIFKE
jgi:hypothetical protein